MFSPRTILLHHGLASLALIATSILLPTGTTRAAGPEMSIAVIPKGTTHEFWKSIHAGAIKAQREIEAGGGKVNLIWKGPLREDDREQQIQVVENFTGRKVSGMVLAPLDNQALVDPVDTAVAAKIPVVVIDSGLKTEKITSFVSTDNYAGGVLGAERLGGLLGGKGNVMLLRYQQGSASTEEREAGFLDTVKKKFPDIKVVSSDQHSGATRDTAYAASQNVLNRFGSQLQGVFTPNESSTAGMVLAMRDAGLAGGKVKLVGFDASTPLQEAMRAGDLQGVVVQDPFNMGYLGVKTLVQSIKGESVEKRVATPIAMITPENMKEEKMVELLNPPLDKYLSGEK